MRSDPPSPKRYGGTSQSLKSGVGEFTLPGARRPRLFTRCDLSLRDGPGREARGWGGPIEKVISDP